MSGAFEALHADAASIPPLRRQFALGGGLCRKVVPREIARFIKEIVRPHVVDADPDSGGREMDRDEMREGGS